MSVSSTLSSYSGGLVSADELVVGGLAGVYRWVKGGDWKETGMYAVGGIVCFKAGKMFAPHLPFAQVSSMLGSLVSPDELATASLVCLYDYFGRGKDLKSVGMPGLYVIVAVKGGKYLVKMI